MKGRIWAKNVGNEHTLTATRGVRAQCKRQHETNNHLPSRGHAILIPTTHLLPSQETGTGQPKLAHFCVECVLECVCQTEHPHSTHHPTLLSTPRRAKQPHYNSNHAEPWSPSYPEAGGGHAGSCESLSPCLGSIFCLLSLVLRKK